MSISPENFQQQLQLEGATLARIEAFEGQLLLHLEGVETHHEGFLEFHQAQLVLSDASLEGPTAGLPSEILDFSISSLGIVTFSVFVPLPFSVVDPCRVDISLRSGGTVTAFGSSCGLRLGPGVRHPVPLRDAR